MARPSPARSNLPVHPTAEPHPTLNRPDELVFLPLGGVGEIGMNLALYGFAGQWLMVDLGITFGDDTTPGLDILMPDPQFIADRRDTLAGLVLTHAHEDHLGAVPHLWPRLRCPIYATAFTASVLRNKLKDAGLLNEARITEVPLSGRFSVGAFDLEYLTVTHSIPEPNALLIETKAGRILHTGDWKFDPDPQLGEKTDFAAFERLAEAGLDAIVCDSTNATRPGVSGSEADVRRTLIDLVKQYDQRVVITCFASNVARMESAARAAEAAGRSCALVGRSLWKMEQAARENGYLKDVPPFVREEDVMDIPGDKIVLVCTGSQGEARAALPRIATGNHQQVQLSRGDVVIFSSRVIPGNERPIGRLQNELSKSGIHVVTDSDEPVHVSGHPARDELARMYQMTRPRLAVPVHGEARHLQANAEVAEASGVPQTLIGGNGDIMRLAGGPVGIIDRVDTGRLGLDGKNLVALEGGAFKTRMRMTEAGAAVATVVIDQKGRMVAPARVTVHGLLGEEGQTASGDLERAVDQAMRDLPASERQDDEAIREAARLAVRRSLWASHGKRPVTDVHVVRI